MKVSLLEGSRQEVEVHEEAPSLKNLNNFN